MITNPAPGRPEPVRVTRGLIAFMAVMVLPAILATAIVGGAWAVSDEVYAAQQAAADGRPTDVAGWKTSLVAVCPIH